MLFHDWKKHPLLFENKALRDMVLDSQVKAVTRLKEGHDQVLVMRTFSTESQLLKTMEDSL